MDSTYPNRHYQWGAQDGGTKGNALPPAAGGFAWETIFDRAISRGLTARYYYSDLPFAALYGSRGIGWVHPVVAVLRRRRRRQAPQHRLRRPRRSCGEDQGTSGDEHPHGDIRVGQAFMSDVVHAFMRVAAVPARRPVHRLRRVGRVLRPRQARATSPTAAQNHRNLANDYGLTGLPDPRASASRPYSRQGRRQPHAGHPRVDPEADLLPLALGHLNKRHRYAINIGRSLDFAHPNREPPSLPDPAGGRRHAVHAGRRPGPSAARPKPHDMAKLESSGLVERYGYEVLHAELRPALPPARQRPQGAARLDPGPMSELEPADAECSPTWRCSPWAPRWEQSAWWPAPAA